MYQVRIKSDGMRSWVYLVDGENEIDISRNVRSIEWVHGAGGVASVRIEFMRAEADVMAEVDGVLQNHQR